ncbi:MAG: hypothetical protein ABJK28_06645 [Algibacter sp.]
MKLKKLLFFTLCISLFACSTESSNDDNETNDDLILLKKTIENVIDGDTFTTNYTYDANTLTNIKDSDGYETSYTYSDGKLIKYENIENGTILSYVIISYDSDELTSFTEFYTEASGLASTALKFNITYNSDNTITEELYSGDHDSQTNLVSTSTIKLIDKEIIIDEWEENEDIYTYEYDNYNSIYKNINNIETIILTSRTEFGWPIYGATKNVTKIIEYQEGWNTTEDVFEYTYNDLDYPSSAKLYYDSDTSDSIETELSSTMEFFYE